MRVETILEVLCDKLDESLKRYGHAAGVMGGIVDREGVEFYLNEHANVDTELLGRELGYAVTVHNRGRSVKVWRNK